MYGDKKKSPCNVREILGEDIEFLPCNVGENMFV